VFCADKRYLGTLKGDSMEPFFMYTEIKRKDTISQVIEGNKYVKVFYDLSNDGICNMISYHELIYSEFNFTDGGEEIIWKRNWFRKEIDEDKDGVFDFYLEIQEDGKIIQHDF
jgi:hypothetical protein